MKKIFACFFIALSFGQSMHSCSNSGQSQPEDSNAYLTGEKIQPPEPSQGEAIPVDLKIFYSKMFPLEDVPCVPSSHLSDVIPDATDPSVHAPILRDVVGDVLTEDIHAVYGSISLQHLKLRIEGASLSQDIYFLIKGYHAPDSTSIRLYDQRRFILSPSGFVLELMNDGTKRNVGSLSWSNVAIDAEIPAREVQGIVNQYFYSIQALSHLDRTTERWIKGPLNDTSTKMCAFDFNGQVVNWIEFGDSNLGPKLRSLFRSVHSLHGNRDKEGIFQVYFTNRTHTMDSIDNFFIPSLYENSLVYEGPLNLSTFFLEHYFDRIFRVLGQQSPLYRIFQDFFIHSFFQRYSLSMALQSFWQRSHENRSDEQKNATYLGAMIASQLEVAEVTNALAKAQNWSDVQDAIDQKHAGLISRASQGWLDSTLPYHVDFDPALLADEDQDGLPVFIENKYSISTKTPDTDQDGYSDLIELEFGTDPRDSLSFPQGLAFDQLFNDWIQFIPSKLQRLSLKDDCGEAQNLIASGAIQRDGNLFVSGYLGGNHKKGAKWRIVTDLGDGLEVWLEFREGHHESIFYLVSVGSGEKTKMAQKVSAQPIAVHGLEALFSREILLNKAALRVMFMTLNQQETLCQQSPWVEVFQL